MLLGRAGGLNESDAEDDDDDEDVWDFFLIFFFPLLHLSVYLFW